MTDRLRMVPAICVARRFERSVRAVSGASPGVPYSVGLAGAAARAR